MISQATAAQVSASRALIGVGLSMGLSAAQVEVMFDRLASLPMPETVGEAHTQLVLAINRARDTEPYPADDHG